MQRLKVYHHRKGPNTDMAIVADALQTTPWLKFSTCQRDVYISLSDNNETLPINSDSFSYYEGTEAYQFLLETICGLHSELIGETEVFGQFKNFLKTAQAEPEFAKFQPVAKNLLQDCKLIREKHLLNLGQHSYGSMVRKHVKPYQQVVVLGGGVLAKDILPWMQPEKRQVHVLVRRQEMVSELQTAHPKTKVMQSQNFQAPANEGYALVIAAPVENENLLQLIEDWGSPALVLDLRDLNSQPPVSASPWLSLRNLFSEIQHSNQVLKSKALAAAQEILRLVTVRSESMTLRPFGWEDVCA